MPLLPSCHTFPIVFHLPHSALCFLRLSQGVTRCHTLSHLVFVSSRGLLLSPTQLSHVSHTHSSYPSPACLCACLVSAPFFPILSHQFRHTRPHFVYPRHTRPIDHFPSHSPPFLSHSPQFRLTRPHFVYSRHTRPIDHFPSHSPHFLFPSPSPQSVTLAPPPPPSRQCA